MHDSPFQIHILPRQVMTREEFEATAPYCSLGLDGMVSGGPYYNEATKHANFDHHDSVVREATMSTAMQVFVAIKSGLMDAMRINGRPYAHIYINDIDQDTSFAVWLLLRYKQFEKTQSIPHVNRLLALSDRWDITGGAFPINLSDQLVRQHTWVFNPYATIRKSGELATATAEVMRSCMEAIFLRLDRYLMGNAGEAELDTRHEILFDSPEFKIVDEIGGNDARYYLFSIGMNAFISIVARRPDGRMVCSVGRRSQYIPFPVPLLYDAYNDAEGVTREKGWNGSDIVGGCRNNGTGLSWEQLRDITLAECQKVR